MCLFKHPPSPKVANHKCNEMQEKNLCEQCWEGMKMRLIGALVVDEAVMMTGVGAQEGPRQRTEACRLGTTMSTMT